MEKIISGSDYKLSLLGRSLTVYFLGQKVEEPSIHPAILPSVNAVARTYDLGVEAPELATVISPFTGERVSRFLHICTSVNDLVLQNKMQRKLGQDTGTCFQRCVGMDAFNALYSVSFEIDQQGVTHYHERLKKFLTLMHLHNYVVAGAMTDVKGDRSQAPSQQADPDMYVHIVERDEKGVYISGAKAHQTGCINAHFMIVMPTIRLREGEESYAIVGAMPVSANGITYVYGRQSCDLRSLEFYNMDQGNASYSGQEALVIFDKVFIPNELIFMNGETVYAAELVDRFTAYHRRSYVCKSGVGDVLIGAAACAAEMNGVDEANHIKDKLVEMNFKNETIYATGIAASYQGYATASGAYICDSMLANVCKHHVTNLTYDLARLAQDIAGGLVATMPSAADLNHAEIGGLIDKYLRAKADVPTENRMRILRLIENMTLGRNAVGYLTESLHGAGSPESQRIQIRRLMQIEYKKRLALVLSGQTPKQISTEIIEELSGFMGRVFSTKI